MRIVSGTTGEYLYFVAYSTVGVRITDLSSFAVYASVAGSTGALQSTATSVVNSTQMPGVYKMLLDSTTPITLPTGVDSREVCFHITNSSGMEPVTRTIEVYRRTATTGTTITVDSSGAGNANTVEVGGTTQTARDLGASVLLSSGTGAGQIVLTSGVVSANATQIAGVAVNTTLPQLGVNIVSINNSTVATGTAQIGVNAVTVSTAAGNTVADQVLDRNMATGTDSGSGAVRTVRQALRFLRNRWVVSGGTMTVYKEDDTASSWTSTVTTSATADPIIESNPGDV